jgi:glucose repression regulatory protein TUP1
VGANQGFPDDLDIHTVDPALKKEGTDWFAIFNPKVKRQLDVSLVHTLMHERSVIECLLLLFVRADRSFVVLYVASDSQLMVNISRQGATGPLRFTILRRVRRLGMSAAVICRIIHFDNTIFSVLVDEGAGKSGDLYIRSVCFSPDGKFLATGAEDKQIRVRMVLSTTLSTALNAMTDLGHS